ncbi:MAG TPA: hypothetical protein VFP95_06460 [Gammaproteobacteria bacterium]|nr:hypothetical protein [Gammaproteobacteria bacterium]
MGAKPNIGDLTMNQLVERGIAMGRTKKHTPEPCRCPAYSFPHREYSGQCEGREQAWCSDCGKPCGVRETHEDETHECWGHVATTRFDFIESDCCGGYIETGERDA